MKKRTSSSTIKNHHQITVQNVSGHRIPSRHLFVEAACCALQRLKNPVMLSIRIVDESESAALNERYRRKIGSTNVLAFPMETVLPDKTLLLGDIVICAPVVYREAKAQKKTRAYYFAHMVIHGSLHLLGFDHKTDKEAKVMERLETICLEKLGPVYISTILAKKR